MPRKKTARNVKVKRSPMQPKPSPEAVKDVTPLLHKGAGRRPKPRIGRGSAPTVDPEDIGATEPAPPRRRDASGKMAARSAKQHEIDEAAVANLAVRAYTPRQISEKLGLSYQVVQSHLNNLKGQFQARASESAEFLRGVQSLQIDHLLTRCLEAIDQSEKPLKKRTVEALRGVVGNGKGSSRTGKVIQVTQERIIDVNHVFAATGLLARKAKLHGLDAPVDLNLVIEARESGMKAVLEAVQRHVKDPEAVKAIAEELAGEHYHDNPGDGEESE